MPGCEPPNGASAFSIDPRSGLKQAPGPQLSWRRTPFVDRSSWVDRGAWAAII